MSSAQIAPDCIEPTTKSTTSKSDSCTRPDPNARLAPGSHEAKGAALQRKRCLVPASGFWEPEKPGRTPGKAPWSYYSMRDGRPFFMAGLWSSAPNLATGEVADSYTVIITDSNAAIRVHDRMPAILAPEAARRWIEPGPLPAELLGPYPAEEMVGWRVADDAKSSRIEPHAGMAEPIAAG